MILFFMIKYNWFSIANWCEVHIRSSQFYEISLHQNSCIHQFFNFLFNICSTFCVTLIHYLIRHICNNCMACVLLYLWVLIFKTSYLPNFSTKHSTLSWYEPLSKCKLIIRNFDYWFPSCLLFDFIFFLVGCGEQGKRSQRQRSQFKGHLLRQPQTYQCKI